MRDDSSPVLFHETLQGVPKWFARALVVAGCTAGATILLVSREHHADALFWLAVLPSIAAAILAPLVIAMWRLDTEVRPGMLAVRLHPFTKRRVPLADVESCEPRTYSPIRDYLGWGWRIGPAGRALTVPGRRGVQLILRGGERLLISSDQPEKLADAVRSAPRHA